MARPRPAPRRERLRISAGIVALAWLLLVFYGHVANVMRIGVAMVLIYLVVGLAYVIYPQIKKWRVAHVVRDVDTMTGIQFEQYTAAVLRGAGYRVKDTPTSGDFGVDLIARKGTRSVAVQCKRQARPVGVAAVQQVVAGSAMYGCGEAMVVTNHSFTPAAVRLAQVHNCQLVDRDRLLRYSRAIALERRGS